MTDDSLVRDSNGKFVPGHANVSPGRPKRAIETDYARVVADAVSLETWKAIVDKAVTDATAGDSKAREFIAVRLIGDGALPLMQLAVREFAQIGSDEEVSAAAELTAEHATSFRASFDESDTPLDYAIVRRVRKADEARKAAECKQRAEKRAARDAAKAATDGK